jgi:hypothetical protein
MILSDYPSQIFGTPLPDNYKIFLSRLQVELTPRYAAMGLFLVREAGLLRANERD